MSILFLGLIAFLGYSVYSKGYFRFQPEGKRYEKNSGLIQDYLLSQQPFLVDFGDDELELLSGNKQKEKSRSFFNSPTEGILLSIYHEPFITYKSIFHSNELKTGVIGIATHKEQYVYILKKDHVDIFVNKKPFGTIKGDGQLISPNDKEALASYILKNDTSYLIRVNNTPEAEVKHHIESNSLPQRILDIYGPSTPEVNKLVKILSFYLIGLGLK
jgi:hypothetical protein